MWNSAVRKGQMAGQVRERVLCPCSHTHTHAFIPMLLWKWKKKANPQTTARGACANLLLTCENELPRLITWQRLDHSCQPKTRVVCQQETKSDTCWKGFVCSSFLIFFPSPPPPPFWEFPHLLSLIICLAVVPRLSGPGAHHVGINSSQTWSKSAANRKATQL